MTVAFCFAYDVVWIERLSPQWSSRGQRARMRLASNGVVLQPGLSAWIIQASPTVMALDLLLMAASQFEISVHVRY